MAILTEFKDNVFKVLEGYLPLAEFEKWLYKSDELLNLMSRDVVLEAFTFNYKQDDAKYRFKKAIFPYFDEDEFMLWKVKSNLRDLIANSDNRDCILYDFYDLSYDEYPWLQKISSYMFILDEIEYFGNNRNAKLLELKQEARELLFNLEKQEVDKPGFRLGDYLPDDKTAKLM